MIQDNGDHIFNAVAGAHASPHGGEGDLFGRARLQVFLPWRPSLVIPQGLQIRFVWILESSIVTVSILWVPLIFVNMVGAGGHFRTTMFLLLIGIF